MIDWARCNAKPSFNMGFLTCDACCASGVSHLVNQARNHFVVLNYDDFYVFFGLMSQFFCDLEFFFSCVLFSVL